MTLPIPTAEIAERFWKGETVAALSSAFHCHRNTILYRLNQAGARTRTEAKISAKVMLTTHGPVLAGLLAQLEKSLSVLRDEFAAEAGNRERRQKFLSRIERMEAQIFALRELTGAHKDERH